MPDDPSPAARSAAPPSPSGSAARVLAAVFAHPDDETFSVGGTLARYADAGVACHLLCATDGDAGQSSGVPVDSPSALGTLRRAELHEAARVLGVRSVHALGWADGRLPQHDPDAVVAEVVRFLRQHRPQVVVTFGPEGAPNGHRDHRAISRAATAAFFLAGLPTAFPDQLEQGLAVHAPRRLYYCSWDPPPPDAELPLQAVPLTARLDVAHWLSRKRAAFEAHRTQHVHRDRFEALGITPTEAFAFVHGVPQPRPVVEDLFEGLDRGAA